MTGTHILRRSVTLKNFSLSGDQSLLFLAPPTAATDEKHLADRVPFARFVVFRWRVGAIFAPLQPHFNLFHQRTIVFLFFVHQITLASSPCNSARIRKREESWTYNCRWSDGIGTRTDRTLDKVL